MEFDFLGEAEYEALTEWAVGRGTRSWCWGLSLVRSQRFARTPLADVLPVEFVTQEEADPANEPFTMDLTSVGQAHPIFQVRSDRVQNKALWDRAAQLAGCSLVKRAKPGADVLATNPITSVDGKPAVVVAVQNFGQGKSMVVTTDTTWRWSRVARLKGQGDVLYARFWSQAGLLADRPRAERRTGTAGCHHRPTRLRARRGGAGAGRQS
ncbi:MAG: hypothetical protein Ct9H300mP1_16650 [Planctomycetaceae bacterium]|nr:MAG: hypothetical protein Ct9H300mP1_16650 [Planctomycetaceae bacterium]